MKQYTEREIKELIEERNAMAYEIMKLREEVDFWKEKAMVLEREKQEKAVVVGVFSMPIID